MPEIDSLRFVAITATLANHIFGEIVLHSGQRFAICQVAFNELMHRMGRGVPLFFAISGFILAQPFLRQHVLHGQPVSLKAYFKRRLTRLEPPYILSLLIYATVQAVRHSHPRSLILPLLAHIFYIQTFLPMRTLNFVTWSLEVEVQFYILAPALGYLYTISSPVLRRGLIITLLLSSAAIQNVSHGIVSRSLPGQLQFFLVGFLLGRSSLQAQRSHNQLVVGSDRPHRLDRDIRDTFPQHWVLSTSFHLPGLSGYFGGASEPVDLSYTVDRHRRRHVLLLIPYAYVGRHSRPQNHSAVHNSIQPFPQSPDSTSSYRNLHLCPLHGLFCCYRRTMYGSQVAPETDRSAL
jgi:hypothetical protein